MSDSSRSPVLVLQQIRKSFGRNQVLKGVHLEFRAGEITALIGANGAGKSTLMKIISGQIQDYEGRLLWRGAPLQLESPAHAFQKGIYMIPQELGLVPDLTVQENLVLGHETYGALGVLDRAKNAQIAQDALKKIHADIPLDHPVSSLSAGKQQMVAIARSFIFDSDFLIFDEPTSMLTSEESKELFEVLKDLRRRGKSIIYITHRLGEVHQFSDRIVGLRDGLISGIDHANQVEPETMVQWMVGDQWVHRSVDPSETDQIDRDQNPLLRVESLTNEHLSEISFQLYPGEILGLVGLMGSGRSEILRAIAGVDSIWSGKVTVNGKRVPPGNVQEAIRNGILMSPEDRRRQGLLLDQSVGFNTFIPNSDQFSQFGILHSEAESKSFSQAQTHLKVDVTDHWQTAETLSGGNQQRLILGKILLKGGQVLLLDEITTGVDIRIKNEILSNVRNLAQAGKSILFASSEWEEVTEVSDRILLIRGGRIVGELERQQFNCEQMMKIISEANDVKEAVG